MRSFTIYYRDGDGFGDDAATLSLCDASPPGYVATAGDCDDVRASINPSAVELGDGIDNDCDGEEAPLTCPDDQVLNAAGTACIDEPVDSPARPAVRGELSPVLECATLNADGSRTALFGYMNRADVPVSAGVDAPNKMHYRGANRGNLGQPEVFQPGRKWGVFIVDYDGSNLVWNLLGRTSTAGAVNNCGSGSRARINALR